jgi:hypothetical protein
MESPLFQDALDVAEARFGAAARRTCLKCHAPVAVEKGDLNLRQKVSWEGVTCDYCHSIKDVSLGGPNPKAVVEFSIVKSGPFKDADSSAHGMSTPKFIPRRRYVRPAMITGTRSALVC